MKLLIDDNRNLDEFGANYLSRTFDDGLKMLRENKFDTLFLDNDLGEGFDKCGFALIKQAHKAGILPETVILVSGSTSGREIMGIFLKEYGYTMTTDLWDDKTGRELPVWEKKKKT